MKSIPYAWIKGRQPYIYSKGKKRRSIGSNTQYILPLQFPTIRLGFFLHTELS
jgi:hypothetical protein